MNTEHTRTTTASVLALPVNPDAFYSVDDVCRLGRISRATLYRAWAAGDGPRKVKRGTRTLVRGRDYLSWAENQHH